MGYLRRSSGDGEPVPGDRRPWRPHPALEDAWLLTLFPGRTLEELDGMDYARVARALAARAMQRVHEKVLASQRGAKDIMQKDDWLTLREMDRLEQDYYG